MSESGFSHEDCVSSLTQYFVKEFGLSYERDKDLIEHIDGCHKQIMRLQDEFVKLRNIVTESTDHALYGWPDQKEDAE